MFSNQLGTLSCRWGAAVLKPTNKARRLDNLGRVYLPKMMMVLQSP